MVQDIANVNMELKLHERYWGEMELLKSFCYAIQNDRQGGHLEILHLLYAAER